MKVQTIYGPPGTGKTRTLVDIAEEESKKVSRILMLSYTRAAAEEGLSRVDSSVVKASTIHSLAYSALGIIKASVVDAKKLSEFGKVCGIPFASRTGDDFETQEGDDYASVLSFARNRMIDPWEAWDYFGRPGQSDRYKMFTKSYPEWKSTYGYVDFDDMLERLPGATAPAYPVVLLDEGQDCSPLQWRAFESVARRAERVYVAGDDDQAIFEWSGADPHGMNTFAENTNSDHRVLDQSHRVPITVLDLAKKSILQEMGKRVDKHFLPMNNKGTITRYGDLFNYNFNKMEVDGGSHMILVRDRWRMKEVQKILHEDFIPYTSNGTSPYENKFADAIRGVLKLNEGIELLDRERSAIMLIGRPSTIEDAREKRYISIGTKRWQDCLVIPTYLVNFYENAPLFLKTAISLSTIHGAKGKEADTVIVDLTLSARTEHSLSLDRDPELRVMYVAVTRAKQNLVLIGSNPLL